MRKARIRLKVDYAKRYPAGTELDVELYSTGSHCFSPVGWQDLATGTVLWLHVREYEFLNPGAEPVPQEQENDDERQ